MNWQDLVRLRSAESFGFGNGGWVWDAYPDLERLDAGARATVAEIDGPAVVTGFHCVRHTLPSPIEDRVHLPADVREALCARGIVLEIYYDGSEVASVSVPLADFFADGCAGRGMLFTSNYVEKAPHSYNCFIPMPFAKHARIVLRNDTEYNMMSYSFVEWERLPQWNGEWAYFHAGWRRFAFQLTPETALPVFELDGHGHLLGRSWSICTDESLFENFGFVMEANNQVFVDGSSGPVADYLGSEDSFGFSWGWPERFAGMWNGITHVKHKSPCELSTFRFLGRNVLPFNERLLWKLDWSNEFHGNPFLDRLRERNAEGGGWIDYAATHYWYRDSPGGSGGEALALDQRIAPILHPNPR